MSAYLALSSGGSLSSMSTDGGVGVGLCYRVAFEGNVCFETWAKLMLRRPHEVF